MTEHILTPFNKLPSANVTTVLLVGDQGTGKYDLARSLVNLKTTFSLQVRTATTLPLPEDTNGTRPRIDFVVIIADLTSKKSVTVAANCAAKLDVDYFTGKCCFVATNINEGEKQTVDIESITELAHSYHCHIFSGNLKEEKSCAVLAGHILKMAATSSSFPGCSSSLLVCSTQTPLQMYIT